MPGETLPSTLRTRDKKRRKKLREKLAAEGVNEELIERIIERQAHDDRVARLGLDWTRDLANDQAHRRDPDDAGWQPSDGDPLLRGPARVGGITAKVVRRGETITKFQYDREIENAR